MDKIKILIAEDEAIIAQCLKMELELDGYDVCSFVASGEEAIVEVKEKNPDVVLMDINLSGKIDGIEAAKKIIGYKYIPIIFMTGYTESDFYKKAQEVKHFAYFEKPVEVYDIEPVINSFFT